MSYRLHLNCSSGCTRVMQGQQESVSLMIFKEAPDGILVMCLDFIGDCISSETVASVPQGHRQGNHQWSSLSSANSQA